MALIDAAARYEAAKPKNPRCLTCQFLARHPEEGPAIEELYPALGALVISNLLAEEYPTERVPGETALRAHINKGHWHGAR